MIDDAKATLRRALRTRRKALQARAPDAAELVVDHFRAEGLPPPEIAALYSPQGCEIDPTPLALYLLKIGARIAVPVVVKPGAPLIFQAVTEFPGLEAADPLSPPPEGPVVDPELIIVPLLAFDATGARLGQGGGFYDRTLEVRRKLKRPPLAIGLAYAGQKVDEVPTGEYDERLDGVLTETGFIDFRGAR